MILHLIGDIGVDGALYKTLEFTGSAIRNMSMDGRFTICNMAIEAGAKNGIIPPDAITEEYLKGRKVHKDVRLIVFPGTQDIYLKAIELAVQWNTDNILEQPKIIKDISAKAKDKCEKLDIYLVSSECIMPIFITTYENIINYIKIKRKELDKFEYEINFASVFYIGARESEEDTADIYIRPNIESKLKLKNDLIATAKHE